MGGANQRYKTPQDGGWGVRNPWPVQVQTNGMPGQGESGAEALPRLWGSTSGRRCGGRRQPLEPSHRTTVWEGPMILNFTPPGGGEGVGLRHCSFGEGASKKFDQIIGTPGKNRRGGRTPGGIELPAIEPHSLHSLLRFAVMRPVSVAPPPRPKLPHWGGGKRAPQNTTRNATDRSSGRRKKEKTGWGTEVLEVTATGGFPFQAFKISIQ